jgi:hypothetical protein
MSTRTNQGYCNCIVSFVQSLKQGYVVSMNTPLRLTIYVRTFWR